jgi:hypothetical protein
MEGEEQKQQPETPFSTSRIPKEVEDYLDWFAKQGGPWTTRVNRPAWEMGVLAWGVAYTTLGHHTRLVQKDGTEHTGLVATLPPEVHPDEAVLLHRIQPKNRKAFVQAYPAWLCQVALNQFKRRENRALAIAAQEGWIKLVAGINPQGLVRPVEGLTTLYLDFVGTRPSREQ